MNNETNKMKVTGTTVALAKLSRMANVVVNTNPRTGALYVEIDCPNQTVELHADARADHVAYRMLDGSNHECRLRDFLAYIRQ